MGVDRHQHPLVGGAPQHAAGKDGWFPLYVSWQGRKLRIPLTLREGDAAELAMLREMMSQYVSQWDIERGLPGADLSNDLVFDGTATYLLPANEALAGRVTITDISANQVRGKFRLSGSARLLERTFTPKYRPNGEFETQLTEDFERGERTVTVEGTFSAPSMLEAPFRSMIGVTHTRKVGRRKDRE